MDKKEWCDRCGGVNGCGGDGDLFGDIYDRLSGVVHDESVTDCLYGGSDCDVGGTGRYGK